MDFFKCATVVIENNVSQMKCLQIIFHYVLVCQPATNAEGFAKHPQE